MPLPRIFRTARHNQFDYHPRFYDAQKEELQERLDSIRKIEEDDSEARRSRISRGLRRSSTGDTQVVRNYRSAQVNKSNKTLVMVLATLLVLFYVVYKGVL